MPLPTVKSIYVGMMFSYLFFYVRKSIGRRRRKLWTSVYATFFRGCGLCDYRIFSKTPPSPLNLKRGSTSPPAPSPQERSPTGKPAVLYSQTSSRPKGLLVEFNATELRVFMRRGRHSG